LELAREHAFDGFLAIGRGVLAAPIGNGLVATSPFPALIRTDNTTPVIQIETEGDIEELGFAFSRQPDNTDLRTWELAGAAHIDLHEGLYEGGTILRENPQLTAPQCVFGVMARSAAFGSRVKVCGSMSANTGLRPATRVISGTTQKVRAGTMISDPAGKSSAFRIK